MIQPRISYEHVLRELSVNREDPCEIIRELISNAYDAGATEIKYFPVVDKKGFIFWDNGEGMGMDNVPPNDVSGYQAFFSIGLSTRTPGKHVGYKCQGSKLCFASNRITIVTRCNGELSWRFISINDPRSNLSNPQSNDITPKNLDDPTAAIIKLFGSQPHVGVLPIVQQVKDIFSGDPASGTIIFVEELDVGQEIYSKYFTTVHDATGKHDLSYIWNYVRLCTKHGDVRILNSSQTGFSATSEKELRPAFTPAKLSIWTSSDYDNEGLTEIPPGFWYLPLPKDICKSPAEVIQWDSARFSARFAGRFTYLNRSYEWILAIDGKRKAQDDYYTLDRQGRAGARSGYPFKKIRGCYLAAEGVKVCEFPGLFDQDGEYAILANPKAHGQYLFILNGGFKLRANRNGITSEDAVILENVGFKRFLCQKIEDAVKSSAPTGTPKVQHQQIFDELIKRLGNEIHELARQKESEKIQRLRDQLPRRERFTLTSGPLKGKSFVSPIRSEENWVGALYSMLCLTVDPTTPQKDLWVRPVTMSGVSLDAFALPVDSDDFSGKFVSVEYKYAFDRGDEFNHPLYEVDYIICWEFAESLEALLQPKHIEDTYECGGWSKKPILDSSGTPLYYEISDIARIGNNPINKHPIKVISLKSLINETFMPKWHQALPGKDPKSQKRKKRGR